MKVSKLVLPGIILASFAASYTANHWLPESAIGRPSPEETSSPAGGPASASRIVSLAPSITEILFAIGVGERVVGVTRYCDYPPAALSREKVGGYYEPNYEAILAQQPDLIFALPEHNEVIKQLDNLGLNSLRTDHRTVSGIMNSIARIGEATGADKEAKALRARLKSRVDNVRTKVEGRPRTRVLVSIGRKVNEGTISRATACGSKSYYGDLIRIAGGENVYTGDAGYPNVSTEGILAMDPDVIIDLVSDMEERGLTAEGILAEWSSIQSLSAVRNNRVHVLGGDHLIVPGPRFIRLLEDLAWAIHPELAWKRQ